jgi:P-type Cu+ transporter
MQLQEPERNAQDPGAPHSVVLEINGMRCSNCAASIESALGEIAGVTRPRVSYALEEARLEFDPAQTGLDAIIEAVRATGYEARQRRRQRASERAARNLEEERAATARRRRMTLGLLLSAVIMLLSMGPHWIGLPDFPGRLWVVCLAAGIVQIFVGGEYYVGAWSAARVRTTNMDTLVALGSSVAFFYSFVVLLLDLDRVAFPVYFESAAMIVTLVMVGKFLEARARRDAGDAVRELLAYQPDTARVIRDGETVLVDVEDVLLGDRVLVQPGEKFPLDGQVSSGTSHVDESMLTGESDPNSKHAGDPVFAGTINLDGAIRFRVTAIGDDTTFAVLVALVREAQATRAPIQTNADRVAAIFVPIILVLSVVVGLYWILRGGALYFPDLDPISTGLVFSAATLLIACPCAMGLATPLALIAGTGVGATRGLLFKTATALETSSELTSIVLDKTGTLTMGRPAVAHIEPLGRSASEILHLAASAEHDSEHPLAKAILAHASQQGLELSEASEFKALAGEGIRARVDGQTVIVGNRAYLTSSGISGLSSAPESESAMRFEDEGMTVAFVAIEGRIAGWIAIGDPPVPTSAAAVERLKRIGLSIEMLTGDELRTARAVARRLGIEDSKVHAGVLPADKAAFVRALQERGECVAMVGDGINDAPALAAADVGIAIGSGTDIAVETADIVLIQSDVARVADAIELSRRTLRTIRQNLFWAFAYNVAAIPLAAGAFVPWAGSAYRLGPGVAAGAMALSSLFVVLNSARLRRSAASAGQRNQSGATSQTMRAI